MKRFYISLVSVLMLAAAVLLIGDVAQWWDISSRAEGILGLVAIVPAVLWIFFKGVNIINIGLYLGGIDYILIKKFFGLTGSVILIVVQAVIIVIALVVICSVKNKQLAKNSGESQEAGGENVG